MIEGRALIIGAGGIGCGAALGLAAAGVRYIGVVDDDVVEPTNLHRQILHVGSPPGTPKVDSLAMAIQGRFSGTVVVRHQERFTVATALRLLDGYDVVLDGSDNLGTKFLANDAAVLAKIPLIHGAAVGTCGQLLTVPAAGRPCYRCLFEELPPPESDAPSCAEAGVLGPVPAVIGALQAAEAVRVLEGKTPAFAGRLIGYISASLSVRTVRFRPNPTCAVCGDHPRITTLSESAYGAAAC